jgi:hypothetical protein
VVEVVVAVVVEVVGDVVVVLDAGVVVDVVVVPGLGRHSETSGSGWPMSKAMTSERPWASAKNSPTVPDQFGIALTLTEIGF